MGAMREKYTVRERWDEKRKKVKQTERIWCTYRDRGCMTMNKRGRQCLWPNKRTRGGSTGGLVLNTTLSPS